MAPKKKEIAATIQSKIVTASMVSELMIPGSTLEVDDVQAWLPMVHGKETLIEPVSPWPLIGDVRIVDPPPLPPPWRWREARSDQELDMGSKSRYPCHSPSVRRNYRPPKSAGSNGSRSTAGSFDHVKLAQLRSWEEFSDLDAELSSVSRRYRPPHARQSVSSIPSPSCRYQPPHARESVSSSPHLSSWKDGSNLDLEIYSARWSRRSTPTVRRNASPIPSLSISRIHQIEGNLEGPLSRTRPRTRGDELEEDTGPVPSPRHHQIDPQIGVDWYIQSKARCTPTVRRNACEKTELQKKDSVPKLHNTEPEQVKKSIDSPLSCFDSGPIWDEDEHSHEISSLHYDHGSSWDDDNGQNGLGSTFRVLLCVGDEIVRKDLESELQPNLTPPLFGRCEIQRTATQQVTELLNVERNELKLYDGMKSQFHEKEVVCSSKIEIGVTCTKIGEHTDNNKVLLDGLPLVVASEASFFELEVEEMLLVDGRRHSVLIGNLTVATVEALVSKRSMLKWFIAELFIFDPGGGICCRERGGRQ